jgi:eukaryotic-like serine/threonine-protein kinase
VKLGESIGGRYELEELVGSGGMSSVYRAHDRMLERKVALKILHSRLGDDGEYVSVSGERPAPSRSLRTRTSSP